LRAFAQIVQGEPSDVQVSVDQDDDYVLACGKEGDAEYIISGDPHLLDLKEYMNIPILTPREFTEQVIKKL
jgi:predicted nucleic acid-binding protein